MFGMRPHLFIASAVAAVALLHTPATAQHGATTAADTALLRRMDSLLALAADSGFAGAVLVAKDGEAILHRGYGWLDTLRTRRAEAGTPFWLASISKQFTAAAVLALVEEGRLSLDARLSSYVDDVPPDKRSITLHQLLTHTAGMRQAYAADGIRERAAAIRALLADTLAGPPDGRFSYSNDAYNLLAALVEVRSGRRFEDFVRDAVLRRAGMSESGFWGPDSALAVAPINGSLADGNRAPNWGFRGATGMYSTVADLYRWQQSLRAGEVLSPDSRDRLFSPHVPLGGDRFAGYGWFTSPGPDGTPVVWTRGTESFGHNGILNIYPREGLVIVVLSNAGDMNGVPASRWVAAALERELIPVVAGS
jgi:CubicO group peptidase (beta-lactamase class C family)